MAEFGLPLDTPPMEAVSAEAVPTAGAPWQYEPKWDGFRCLAFKAGDTVELRAKSGKPLGRYFPEVVALLAGLDAPRFVIDGELAIELDGRLSFDALQMRLHPAESRVRKLAVETPARLILFDILMDPDGTVLLGAPLTERRAALEALVKRVGASDRLALSPMTRDPRTARRWLAAAGQGALDGVVAKRLDGPYESGERAMVKVKPRRTADCVVGGFRYQSGARQVGSLLLGLYDAEGRLNHVGFAATIADSERPALTRKLEALREPPGFTGSAPGGPSRWSTARSSEWVPLRPELVVEVAFRPGHRRPPSPRRQAVALAPGQSAGAMHDGSDTCGTARGRRSLRSVTAHLTEPCKTCSGSGLVPRARRRLPNGEIDERDILAWPAVLCETCNGSGQVPVRVESIQEPSPT